MAKRLNFQSTFSTPYSDLSVRSFSSGKAVPALRAKTQHRPLSPNPDSENQTLGGSDVYPLIAGVYLVQNSRNRRFAVRRAAFCCRNDTGSASNASWYACAYAIAIFSRIPAGSVANCSLIHGASSRAKTVGIVTWKYSSWYTGPPAYVVSLTELITLNLKVHLECRQGSRKP
ncbi:Uncharacterised protein [Klebsiella pneumoniae]|nr:Uncharacterised protein [Klebsiella pneumoniae]